MVTEDAESTRRLRGGNYLFTGLFVGDASVVVFVGRWGLCLGLSCSGGYHVAAIMKRRKEESMGLSCSGGRKRCGSGAIM